MKTLLAATLVCLAAPSFGLPPTKPMRGLGVVSGSGAAVASPVPHKDLKSGPVAVDYKVTFSLRNGTQSQSGVFVIGDGMQSNYVAGGEQPWETTTEKGTAVDFKKWGLIVNGLARAAGAGTVDAEFQFELGGPQAPDPASKLKVPPMGTLQLQVSFRAALGKPLVLLEQPERRVEITIVPLEP